MAKQTLMLIGGTDNGDYKWLLSHEGKTSKWSCPKYAAVGDMAFIYVTRPYSQVIAVAPVIKPPRPGRELGSEWRYVAWVGPIKVLSAPIPIAELKELCPEWAWLRYPRAYAYVPPVAAKRLLRRAKLRTPPAENAEVKVTGAGFGDAETNRMVEHAAVEAVKRHFRGKGYRVRSREQEKLGYDLDVENGRRTLHIEVKGISNGTESFPITEREVRCSRNDPQFRLAVVTHARDLRRRQIHLYSGDRFLSQFACCPLAYMARLRSTDG